MTPGWFKKMLLLGLLNIVPILNWIVPGFALRWAREVPLGKREGMPHDIFGDRAFVTGFFYTLLLAIVSIVMSLVGSVLRWIMPYQFSSVAIVLVAIVSLFLGMFANVCIVRMAVCDNLGAAFSFSKCWRAYGKSLGSLFCVSVVPGLITGLIFIGILIIVSTAFSLIAVGSVASYSLGSNYGADPRAAAANMLLQLGGPSLILCVVLWVVFALLQALSITISMRALGHWVARVAPEWANEAQMNGYGTYGAYDNVPGQPFGAPNYYSGPATLDVPTTFAPSGNGSPQNVSAPSSTWKGAETLPVPSSQGVSPQDEGTTRLDAGNDTPMGFDGMSLVLERANGQRFSVSNFPATVGKGTAANVCIGDNNSISRVHVRISKAGSSLVVEDLGATNRTYLNGTCLSEGELVVLHDGDELRLGNEPFVVRIAG